jgi:uracil-DNA glycosylase
MPLIEACSLTSFDQNLRTEIRAGKSPEQAAAIARDILERACQREGKPIPTRAQKAAPKKTKKKTREYLEAALAQARKMLPGWMYSVIHQAALPSSGGRANANRRLSAIEKAWVEKGSCAGMSNGELKSALYKLNKAFAAAKRQGTDVKPVLARGSEMVDEMRKRSLATPGDLAKACQNEAKKGYKDKTKKGFLCGCSEGGAHAHALNRHAGQTGLDGAHGHAFVLPGEGLLVYTAEDGMHAHELVDGKTKTDGKHAHHVYLPSGRELETALDGQHAHGLMWDTTTFAAMHTHELTMPDGTVLTSLTVEELVALLGVPEVTPGLMPPASYITSAMQRSEALQRELELRDTMPLPEAVEMTVKGEELPGLPAEVWEVRDVHADKLEISLMDGTTMTVEKAAIEVMPGDVVDVVNGCVVGFSTAAVADDGDTIAVKRVYADEVCKAVNAIPFEGPEDAKLVFVGSAPSGLEAARRAPLIGPDSEIFEKLYLAPLGLTRKDVGIGFARPVETSQQAIAELWEPWLDRSLARFPQAKVLALGKVAKDVLGDRASIMVPHPSAVRRFGHSGEVTRKLRAVAKSLDIPFDSIKARMETRPKSRPSQGTSGTTLAEPTSELRMDPSICCRVVKAAPAKQIVYGVVLDPYSVDLQNEWVPPATIEDSAHEFVAKSRVIGRGHSTKADAVLVESWVEVYPSQKDREAALENLPHRVFRRAFGDDFIHSGSWVAGVRLSDELWEQYKRGELGAFSVGGFSFKTKVSTDAMPDVEFIDLEPSA